MRKSFAFIICSLIFVNSFAQSDSERELLRMNRWLKYYQIDADQFVDTLNVKKTDWYKTEYDSNENYLEIYKEFFIYSPDSYSYIDIDSYSLILERDNFGKLVSNGSEVDIEVGLVNIKAKERLRLIFCGTTCWPEEAEWIDNNNVLVFGFSENEEKVVPTIWNYNLVEKTLFMISANVNVDKAPASYIENVRLEKVKFEY
jgi:hypothetical protein